jgi:hypothetical protein
MSIFPTTRNALGIPNRKILFQSDGKSPTPWKLTINMHTEEPYTQIFLQNDFVELTGDKMDAGAKISIYVINRGQAFVKNVDKCRIIPMPHNTFDIWFPSAAHYIN